MTDSPPDLGVLLSEAIATADPGIRDRIDTDPSAYLDLVVLTAAANAQTGALLRSAVAAARSAGHSWEAVGQSLRMSRQAAQQRFGRTDGNADRANPDHNAFAQTGADTGADTAADTGASAGIGAGAEIRGGAAIGASAAGQSTSDSDTRTLSPLTAYNEVEILNRAGRYGWHSIGFGILRHTVRRSRQQWEHQRVYVLGQSRRELEASGWQRIGSTWFPFAYYKRCLDLPALPENPGAILAS